MSPLTPDDEALLERARRGLEPGVEDHARIKRRLLARIGVVGMGVGTSASAAAGAATPLVAGGAGALSVVAKIAVTVSLVTGVVGGAAVVHGWTSSKATVERVAPVPAGPAWAAAAPPRAGGLPVAVAPAARALDGTPVASAAPPLPPAIARAPAPSPPHARGEKPADALGDPAATASPVAGPSTVGAEADLLRQADAAMKAGDPERALAFVEQHAASFPRGILVEERDAERVIVTCALGRADEARALASTFLSAHPRSPLVARVRTSCGAP